MKVIFLDIDGVLITPESIYKSKKHYLETGEEVSALDEERVAIIKNIVDRTDAKIVLSSTYKLHFKKNENNEVIATSYTTKLMENIFAKYSLKIYDLTPNDYYRRRYKEISLYLESHTIDSFLIIDDEGKELSEVFPDNFIKIKTPYDYDNPGTEEIGLKPYHIKEAIKILSKKNTHFK